MNITISVKSELGGLEQIIANCDVKTPEIVRGFGFAVEGHAKSFAPVDTGWLRDSLQSFMVDDATARIQSDAEYDIYQELGTYKMAAHPFLSPAIELVASPFLAEATWRPLIE